MKLLHLYDDFMNLYGEYGNVSAIMRMLEKSGIPAQLDRLSLGDNPVIADYDFIYVGSGTESNQKVVLSHLLTLKEELKRFIDEGKVLLMTGNAFELLGEYLTDSDGKQWQGLGLFPFWVKEQNKVRNTGDAIFTMEGLKQPLVGFVNKCSTIEGVKTPLFKVEMGLGNEGKGGMEGIRIRNFFGTHLTGPMLIKNPDFLIYITQLLCTQAGVGQEESTEAEPATETKADKEAGNQEESKSKQLLDTSWLKAERAGYEVTLRELRKRLSQNS